MTDQLPQRREYLKLLLGASAGVAMAGCLGEDDDDTGDVEFEEPLEFIGFGLDFMEETTYEWADAFEAEHGVEVEPIHQPAGDDWHSYFQSRIQADDPPHVINTVHGNYTEYLNVYESEPDAYLSDGFMNRYPDPIVELNEIDGTLYRVPFAMDCGLTWYNQDHLSQAGYDEPPETTDEFFDVAEDVAENSDAEYGLTTVNFEYGYWSFFWSEGIEVLNDAQDAAAFDESRTVEILERFNELYENGVIPEITFTERRNPQLEMFGAGDVAMSHDSASGLILFQDGEWVDEDTLSVTGSPGNAGLSMATGWSIAEQHDETGKEYSGAFIETVLQEEFLEEILTVTTWPLADTGLLEEKIEDEEWSSEYPLRVQIYETFFDVQDDLRDRPLIPEASEIWSMIESEFSEAIRGNIDAEEAVDQAAAQVDSLL